MEQEIWKDVVGYEGLYIASNLGTIVSLPKPMRTPSGTYISKRRQCNLKKDKSGYLRVSLCKNGKTKRPFVHRVIAEAFIGIHRDLTVNHKDEDKSNNRADNLEYMTRAENVRYGTGIERSAKSRTDNPLTGTAVNQYTLDGKFVKRYISINLARRENGWKKENITLCCQHKRNQSNGFIWRYDGDTDVKYEPKTNAVAVTQLTKNGLVVAKFKSLEEAMQQTKIHKGDICGCCRGYKKTAGGYIWKYA